MCGIFGVWNFKSVEGSHIHKASALLRHRGPDDEGILTCSNGEQKAYGGNDTTTPGLDLLPATLSCPNVLLHRRLSILDLSPKGHQPMQAKDRKIHMVFNGEIYNFKELIAKYKLEVFSGTDTEVILQLYVILGTSCFNEFRGMWALAIQDLEKNELILSRDRFGIKPLYFTEVNDGIAFSSEIKPLLALPGIEPTLTRKKLLQFLTFGATDEPHETFFDAIQVVKPGTYKTWNLDTLENTETIWYNLRKQADSESDPDRFTSLFTESIREHMIADVEVGSCLSGGLDSSAIVAKAASTKPQFKTFTCTFPGESIDEADYARKLTEIAPELDQYFTTPTADAFLNSFDDLVKLQERPLGSASIFAQYSVMELAASKGMNVLLDGQGADEVLGGYYPFAGAYLLGLLRKGNFAKFRKELRALKTNFNPAMVKAMLRAGFYQLPNSLQLVARRRGRVGAGLVSKAYLQEAGKLKAPLRGSADFKELTLRSIEFGLYELLHYEDRNAMAFSIESRVPFLDHRLVEWALNQDPGTLIHKGWTKYPIRQELVRVGLSSLAWRKDKLGFVAPQNRWRKELLPALVEKIKSMDIPDIFDQSALSKLFNSDLDSNEHLSEFWRIYSLLRWMEIFKIRLV